MDVLGKFRGSAGVVKCGVSFRVAFFAAIVENCCGDGYGVVRIVRSDALHVEQVAGEVDDGLGVADEPSFSQGVVRVVFACGGCGHGPEAGGCGIEYGEREVANFLVRDEGYLSV